MAQDRKGQVVGGYEILQTLGKGGYGTAYLAQKEGMRVVLKECLVEGTPEDVAALRESLRKEADILIKLRHPNLPRLYTYLTGETQWVVLEYFDGKTLLDLVNERMKMPGWNDLQSHLDDVLSWSRQTAAVLHYLHTLPKPVVHKDIKPDNLLLRTNGQIGLIDFGIARFFDEEKHRRNIADTISVDGKGAVGTQGYVAPEYYYTGRSSPRCDLYSFGVMMYFWLSGVAPDLTEKGKVVQDFAPLPQKSKPLWNGLVKIAAKAMAKEPSHRWQSAEAMAVELAALAGEIVDPARDPQTPCPVCRSPILERAQFCSQCGYCTGAAGPATSVKVDLEFTPLHQQIVQQVLDAAKKPARLVTFQLFHSLQELQKDPGFGVLRSLPYLPRVNKLPHQIEAVRTALGQMHGYCLLADEVGLGKTIEAGIILKELMFRDLARRVLVVASSDGMARQWQRELFEKFEVFFPVYGQDLGYSLGWKCDRVITQYGIVDNRAHCQALLNSRDRWDLIILDEAHHLIAHDPRRGNLLRDFARKLGGKTTYFLMLSATPLHNNLQELHTLLSLLKPGSVGDFEHFREKYIDPNDALRPRNVNELREKLKSVMIRNTRRRIKEMKFPRRVAKAIAVQVEPAHKALVKEFREFVQKDLWGVARSAVDGGDEQTAGPGNAPAQSGNGQSGNGNGEITMGFREAVQELVESFHSSPAAFARNCDEFSERFRSRITSDRQDRLASFKRRMTPDLLGPKVAMVRKILDTLAGRGKFLVFTQYPDTAKILHNALADAQMPIVLYPTEELRDGGMQALAALEDFENNAQAMICSENAAEGLNLQFATLMINFDLPWDPMRLEQRIGRIQRLGQESDYVYIYNLFVPDSVEEDILRILNEKIVVFTAAVGDVEDIVGAMVNDGGLEAHFLDIFVTDPSDTEAITELDSRLDKEISTARNDRDNADIALACLDETPEGTSGPEEAPPPPMDHPPDLFIPLVGAAGGPGSELGSRPQPRSCPACRAALEPPFKFCGECGAQVAGPTIQERSCRACAAVLEPPYKFCGACGTPAAGAVAAETDSEPVAADEPGDALPVFACAKCQALIPEGSASCPMCHEQVLARRDDEDEFDGQQFQCPSCQAELESPYKFCGACGKAVGA